MSTRKWPLLTAVLTVALTAVTAIRTGAATLSSPVQRGGRPGYSSGSGCPDGPAEPGFFLGEFVRLFGRAGEMNATQLQSFLDDIGAKCYSASEVLRAHSLTEAELVNDTKAVLSKVCPTLLYQTLPGVPKMSDVTPIDPPPQEMPTTAQVWGYGVLFVTIINLSALMGACIIPCMDKSSYKMILTYLVGLAIGTLSGNAVLSLIPETHNMYISTHGLDFVWRNTTIIAGIYLFFVVERLLKMISARNSKRSRRKTAPKANSVINVTAMHDLTEHHDVYKITSVENAMGNGNGTPIPEDGTTHAREEDVRDSSHPNGHGHGHSHMLLTEDGEVRVAAVAYMIIFGDGLHNFVDGLAIGASFALSIVQGISTSIAVICEEFPHELGDFAILLRSGMTVKKALMFNFMSALTCYAGLIVGILVGQLTELEPYIFALASGMFLYISLVDMLPELNSMNDSEDFNLRRAMKVFAIQNAGILSGYGIMILLTVYVAVVTAVVGMVP